MLERKPKLIHLFPFVLVWFELVAYLANDAYLPAMPLMQTSLGITAHLTQLTLAAWFLGTCVVQLLLGPLADVTGRKPMLLLGIFFFIISSFVIGFSDNIGIILACRLIQGMASATIFVAGYSTIHELYHQKQAIKIIAWMYSITVLAPALGPFYGQFILSFTNWQWIFHSLALTAIPSLAGIWLTMPSDSSRSPLASLSPRTIYHQYSALIVNRAFITNTFAQGFLFAAMIAWITTGSFLLMGKLELSSMEFCLAQLSIFAMYILGNMLSRHTLDVFQLRTLINLGLYLSLFSGGSCALLTMYFPHSTAALILPIMLFCFGTGIASPILNRLAVESGEHSMATKISLFSFVFLSIGAIGSILASILYNGNTFSLGVVIFLCGVLGYMAKLSHPLNYSKTVP